MPYDPLTPSNFKSAKPQFKDIADLVVAQHIQLAGRFVDESWTEGDYQPAWIAMTCHLMTLDGLGASGESEIQSMGGARLTSMKSGTLSLTFAASQKTGDEFKDWLGSTSCGQFYLLLLQMNRGGPRLLGGGGGRAASGYAKDWPYKFPGVQRGG